MFRTISAFLPGMIAKGGGSIVNMASIASARCSGVPNRFAYAATKAAVIGLTKAVAADFIGEGVRCNAICPGTDRTPSLQQRLHDTGDYEPARKPSSTASRWAGSVRPRRSPRSPFISRATKIETNRVDRSNE